MNQIKKAFKEHKSWIRINHKFPTKVSIERDVGSGEEIRLEVNHVNHYAVSFRFVPCSGRISFLEWPKDPMVVTDDGYEIVIYPNKKARDAGDPLLTYRRVQ